MLSKAGLLRFLMDLAAVNDLDLVEDDALLSVEVCAESDRAAVREAAQILRFLRREFSYTLSPEFEASVVGRSAAYAAMRAKLVSEPTKRAALRRRFDETLSNLPSSDEVFQLLPLPI